MVLFHFGLTDEKLACLAIVIRKAFRAEPELFSLFPRRIGGETSRRIFPRPPPP